MRYFSYVVARDYGFAPNPYGNVCTLATCKPDIRKAAKVGDWIFGEYSDKSTPRVPDESTPDLVTNNPSYFTTGLY